RGGRRVCLVFLKDLSACFARSAFKSSPRSLVHPCAGREARVSASVIFGSSRRRHPLECELLESVARLGDVDIAFRIGGDVMAAADLARNLDRPCDLERLAVDD